MANLKTKLGLTILLSFFALNSTEANIPGYKLSIENLNLTSPNIYEFDIYLQHTNPGETKFEYVLGQYFFEFNPGISNGGTLTYSLVSSDLPILLQPRNPTVFGNQLRLAANRVPVKEDVQINSDRSPDSRKNLPIVSDKSPGTMEILPTISDKSPGTLVARMRLETSEKTFSEASIDLRLREGPENLHTKIFTYVENQIIDITIKEEIASDNLSIENINAQIPTEFSLQQNYPNPFNPATNIKFDVPILSKVELKIYDITGREVAVLVNRELEPGSYSFKFIGNNFASGVYFYRIKAGDASSNASLGILQTKRMVLIK